MTEIVLKGPLDIPIKNSLIKKKTRVPFKPLENQNIILEQVSLESPHHDPSIYAFADQSKGAMSVKPNPDFESKPYSNPEFESKPYSNLDTNPVIESKPFSNAIPAPKFQPVNPVLQSVLKSDVRHVVQSVDPSFNHVMRIPTDIVSQANAPV